MRNLVIGKGEVGKALMEVLQCDGIDEGVAIPKAEIIHIAFPYTQNFSDFVKEYKKRTEAHYVVIHSTVPIGTSKRLDAVHSPIRGVHPHLAEGIRTFVKFFGGQAKVPAREFQKVGVLTQCVDNPNDTEALKLWDTTQYGVLIQLEKEIHAFCEQHDLDFDTVYTLANQTYNEGYTELGMSHVVRPFLKHMPGPIGGHCVCQNAELLNSPAAIPLRKAKAPN